MKVMTKMMMILPQNLVIQPIKDQRGEEENTSFL